ncbi:MAG: hypothetical protein A3K19_03280 [Lentisphaerae bacterium RIFOXYB12_FULL_65_16]|nr:MAG: hypothetical protein A3K18_33075 [Lentisphaerae bacterium RIFOXYA12_64_32]OGV92198.1 MAG: hypothetical protein A3K19_03280 [Lentisphaerae bacterium RIFOXYB12_FULL_65_16]
MAELGFDGALRGCAGALAVARRMPDNAVLIAPLHNRAELGLLRQLEEVRKPYCPYVVSTLAEAAAVLCGLSAPLARVHEAEFTAASAAGVDFASVKGQKQAKRALEVAAAGGHNVLMVGPPGPNSSTLLVRDGGVTG